MIKTSLTIINKLGLHARAAAKLTATASQYACDIKVEKAGRVADCKSIMAVMMLAASQGTELIFHLDGEDEQLAIEALETLINNRFDEAE
ncbi:HPr family phosphocarrier protein [Nitrincola alkalilacustris]|uniref:HPr family phosphocarrier protein n=1 Tax=Nitrincola alkalilacustris TaxID=1571224 RepID=UPI00124C9316|nr:HPr family phosphocarrier protein [Nitrincola alkalilacustris]